MNEIVSADALREQAATHTVAAGRWENGVLLALLRRQGAWWLVLWRGDGPPSRADVARARQEFAMPTATEVQPTSGEWLVWVGGPAGQAEAQFLQIARHGGVVLTWPDQDVDTHAGGDHACCRRS